MDKILVMDKEKYAEGYYIGHYVDPLFPDMKLLMSDEEGELMVNATGGEFHYFKLVGSCKETNRPAFDSCKYVSKEVACKQRQEYMSRFPHMQDSPEL